MAYRTVEELETEYPDAAWRSRFAQICDLVEILATCIIADNYNISDGLRNAIVLSPEGAEFRGKVARKASVGAREATVLCALSLGHDKLFIDVEKTDPEVLADAIHAEILDGRIRLPFIFGRELYNRYAELFDDEKESLDLDETLNLLQALPIGVFQYGHYTTGPFGLRRAPTARSLPATRRVPAYHCARTVCRQLHSVYLDTSRSAPVNRDREKFETALRALEGEPAEWWLLAGAVSGLRDAYYLDQRSGSHMPLLGDALDTGELRLVVGDLLDTTQGQVRDGIKSFLKVTKAEDALRDLSRAHLLQLSLFASEDSVATAIDRLVRKGKIRVPAGEVRRPVMTAGVRSGAFRLRAELSGLGVRFISDEPGFALLRERRLLDSLYRRDSHADVEELEWQLRGIDIDDLDERLEWYFQHRSPRDVLTRLIFARKTNMIAACTEVGVEAGDELSDDVLADTLLWKLGFPVLVDQDPHASFWSRHERLWALAQSSDIGGSERFLEAANPYFSTLEGLLLNSLAFTAWAFLSDHVAADSPFSYDDDVDRAAGLALMTSIASSPVGSSKYDSDTVDLGNLLGGFSALAGKLERLLEEPEDYRRPVSELPEFDGKTRIKEFRLRSTVAFLDLTAPSQARIIAGLRDITKTMTAAEVNDVRNDYSHYRRVPPDIAKLERALEAISHAVTRIETLGFCRILFEPTSVTRDEWGRSRHEYTGPRSYEHAFSRPTRYDWMGLPGLSEPAFLIRSASIGEPSEVLRFTRRVRSGYLEMWSDYPNRRRLPRAKSTETSQTMSSKHAAVAP